MAEIRTELLQAILLNNIKNIVEYQKSNEGFFDKIQDPYNNIITLMDENSALSVGKLLALPDSVVEVYNRMTPLEKGFLYPKVHIYKMNSNGDYTEIKFKNHFDDKQLNLYESEKLANDILAEKDDAYAAGIKSIHIKNRPEREGDVNINVTISIEFESIIALLQSQVRDLINIPLNIDDVNFLDYRLRLVVGWNIPDDYSNNPAIDEQFKNAIEYSEEVYLLYIYKHNISFNENGSVELEIEYGAAIEGYFESNKADILNIDNILQQKAGLKEGTSIFSKIQSSMFKFSQFPEYAKNYHEIERLKKELQSIGINPSESENKKTEEIQKKIGELQEINIKYSKFLRKVRYGYFLKMLYEQGKLFTLDIPEETLQTYNDAVFNNETDKDKILTNKTIKEALEHFFSFPNAKNIRKIGNRKFDVSSFIENENKLVTDVKEGVVADGEQNNNENIQNIEKNVKSFKVNSDSVNTNIAVQTALSSQSSGISSLIGVIQNGLNMVSDVYYNQENAKNKPIYFIKLGDIFEVAASFIEKFDEYNIIFGTIEFYDYKNGKTDTINIADVPISLEHFSMWFINTIIKPQLDSYYYKNFIEDVIRTLLSPLFGFFFSGIKTPLSAVTFNSQIITSTVKIKEKVLTTDQIKGKLVDKNKKEKTFYQYYVIYATILENKDLKGIEKDDIEKGIYHYKIGSSTGVLTRANFVRIDFEKLRDARIVSQNLNTAGQVLREHYNVDLALIGNPLFQNGRLIYMDGSGYGSLGREATESIGLGGYYLVHGIEHVIENGDWKMDIHGIFNSPRFGAYDNIIGNTAMSLLNIGIAQGGMKNISKSLKPGIK